MLRWFQIWEAVDNKQGFLSRAGLYKALALTALAQQGKSINEKILEKFSDTGKNFAPHSIICCHCSVNNEEATYVRLTVSLFIKCINCNILITFRKKGLENMFLNSYYYLITSGFSPERFHSVGANLTSSCIMKD